MKTNSRKRLLVSSVAMLLVAMLALGTATYAWFTQNTSATTSNLSVYTSKSSSLEISKSTAVWGSTVDYEFANKKLLPASTADGKNWFEAVAADEKSFASAKGEVKSISLTSGRNNSYFFKEQLNIRNAGAAAVENVKIKFTIGNSSTYDYLRVALVPTTGTGASVADSPETGKSFVNYVYANTSNNSSSTTGEGESAVTTYSKKYGAIATVTGTGSTQTFTTTDITPISGDATTGLVTIDVTGTGEKLDAYDASAGEDGYDCRYYNLYVWFEGQDLQCYNANAGVVVPDIQFSVEGSTVDN